MLLTIHSGQRYHQKLGTHYGPLIKSTLGLVPMNMYLSMSQSEKSKFRAIQSLPTGQLLGLALIDAAFPFCAEHVLDPWAHGPFCLRVHDVVRFPTPMPLRGRVNIFPIKPRSLAQSILEMNAVRDKINRWNVSFEFESDASALRAVTVLQPFGEAIIRGVKTIENRSTNLCASAGLGNDDREKRSKKKAKQCRVCIGAPDITPQDCQKLGRKHLDSARALNQSLEQTSEQTQIPFHPTATLTECQCRKPRKARAPTNKTKTESAKAKHKKKRRLNEADTTGNCRTRSRRRKRKKRKVSEMDINKEAPAPENMPNSGSRGDCKLEVETEMISPQRKRQKKHARNTKQKSNAMSKSAQSQKAAEAGKKESTAEAGKKESTAAAAEANVDAKTIPPAPSTSPSVNKDAVSAAALGGFEFEAALRRSSKDVVLKMNKEAVLTVSECRSGEVEMIHEVDAAAAVGKRGKRVIGLRVLRFLKKIGLEMYHTQLISQNIDDIAVLAAATEDDLRQCGVELDHRRQIIETLHRHTHMVPPVYQWTIGGLGRRSVKEEVEIVNLCDSD